MQAQAKIEIDFQGFKEAFPCIKKLLEKLPGSTEQNLLEKLKASTKVHYGLPCYLLLSFLEKEKVVFTQGREKWPVQVKEYDQYDEDIENFNIDDLVDLYDTFVKESGNFFTAAVTADTAAVAAAADTIAAAAADTAGVATAGTADVVELFNYFCRGNSVDAKLDRIIWDVQQRKLDKGERSFDRNVVISFIVEPSNRAIYFRRVFGIYRADDKYKKIYISDIHIDVGSPVINASCCKDQLVKNFEGCLKQIDDLDLLNQVLTEMDNWFGDQSDQPLYSMLVYEGRLKSKIREAYITRYQKFFENDAESVFMFSTLQEKMKPIFLHENIVTELNTFMGEDGFVANFMLEDDRLRIGYVTALISGWIEETFSSRVLQGIASAILDNTHSSIGDAEAYARGKFFLMSINTFLELPALEQSEQPARPISLFYLAKHFPSCAFGFGAFGQPMP